MVKPSPFYSYSKTKQGGRRLDAMFIPVFFTHLCGRTLDGWAQFGYCELLFG